MQFTFKIYINLAAVKKCIILNFLETVMPHNELNKCYLSNLRLAFVKSRWILHEHDILLRYKYLKSG